jgi:hypothetical protein
MVTVSAGLAELAGLVLAALSLALLLALGSSHTSIVSSMIIKTPASAGRGR